MIHMSLGTLLKHVSDQGTFTPVGAQRGGGLRKPLSQRNFAIKFAPYMYALSETIIPGKKNKNVVLFQNGGPITDFFFFFLRHFDFGQNLTYNFSKEIFQ